MLSASLQGAVSWVEGKVLDGSQEQDEVTTVILFPEGLVGWPEWRQFALLPGPPGNPVMRLQCLTEPSVCFVIADPGCIWPDYRQAVPRQEFLALGIDSPQEARIYCTLTVREEPVEVTANLLAPLIVDPRRNLGRQVVLADSGFSVRHPVATLAKEEDDFLVEGMG